MLQAFLSGTHSIVVCPFKNHAPVRLVQAAIHELSDTLRRPFVNAMLTLTVSKQPLLELRGARGLGRIAFKAPFYCPNSNRTLLDTKAEIAQSGGVPALIGMLLLPCLDVLMTNSNSKAMGCCWVHRLPLRHRLFFPFQFKVANASTGIQGYARRVS